MLRPVITCLCRSVVPSFVQVCSATPSPIIPRVHIRHRASQSSAPAVQYDYANSRYNKHFRSHLCSTISLEDADRSEHVKICGWLHRNRFDGRFWLVRDFSGLVQVVIDDAQRLLWKDWMDAGTPESVVRVEGVVRRRPPGQENPQMETGFVEVLAQEMQVLNPAMPNLPFSPASKQVNELLRMQHRYLDLRRSTMQRAMRVRSDVLNRMRRFLHDHLSFVDVETPYLFRRTPGGAREFLVPTQLPGKFYALAQSPQQFKQLLMVAGIDRYFQIARCFRDEANNPEKQPEFTQLDLEMSFVDMDSILCLVEDLIQYSWPSHLGPVPSVPFPRMAYQTAMESYGSDKPDTRFEMNLRDVTEWNRKHAKFARLASHPDSQTTVYAISVKQGASVCGTSFRQSIQRIIKQEHPNVLVNFVTKKPDSNEMWSALASVTQSEDGDLVVICAGVKEACQKAVGRIRVEAANYLEGKGVAVRDKQWRWLWIVDFPLFERNSVSNNWETVHHPFTAPLPEDEHLLQDSSKLGQIRGQHYDLVLNGAEVGGGSIRVHNADMQRVILRLLHIERRELEHLLQALASGAPPHGGIALGLDRLIAAYCGANSIRDVIAFPKSTSGRDVMSDSPCEVSEEELKFYGIKVDRPARTQPESELESRAVQEKAARHQ